MLMCALKSDYKYLQDSQSSPLAVWNALLGNASSRPDKLANRFLVAAAAAAATKMGKFIWAKQMKYIVMFKGFDADDSAQLIEKIVMISGSILQSI